jgi:hypothetical protein
MNMPTIDFSKLRPTTTELKGDDDEDTALLQEALSEARAFILNFPWCQGIKSEYVSEVAIGGIVAIFLMEIAPLAHDIDDWLWVVVGDLPPAYLVTDRAQDGEQALRLYVAEMREWVSAVNNGQETEDLIPVGVTADQTNAEALSTRLTYIEENILVDD